MNRREFIKLAGNIPLLVSVPSALASLKSDQLRDYRKVILIELKGGNDGLNTVIPFCDNEYYRLRPTLAINKRKTLSITDHFGLNPNLKALESIWSKGQLAINLGVGYPNPNLSHFRSIEIWDTASSSNKYNNSGWITQLFNNSPLPPQYIANGISIGFDTGPLGGKGSHNIVMKNPGQFLNQANRIKPIRMRDDNIALQHILKTYQEIQKSVSELRKRLMGITNLRYKGPRSAIAKQLHLAALCVMAEIPSPVIKVSIRGFDTHSNQLNKHNQLLLQLSEAIAYFHSTLSKSGHWNNVIIMSYSEFGRRPKENASKGTDHGTSAPHFVIGGKINGGIFGTQPSLSELKNGNMQHTIDFRSLYATIAQNWWGIAKTNTQLDFPISNFLS